MWVILVLYAAILLGVAFYKRNKGNEAFFVAGRKSSWTMVAIGMLGASISGISFISVPGMAPHSGLSYLQLVLGFSLGYILVAHLLLPLYYRLNLTNIYQYLQQRLGNHSYRTASLFFIISRGLGAAARLFISTYLIYNFIFAPLGIPFYAVAILVVVFMYAYTSASGIQTLVKTDVVQTLFLLGALTALLLLGHQQLSITSTESLQIPWDSLIITDWDKHSHFLKYVLSGMFITVCMTGLDQDMMQKNLTCKSLKEAQKNMLWYGFMFLPINFAFLLLGFILVQLYSTTGTPLPLENDLLLPVAIQTGLLPDIASYIFIIGIISATFSSADSTLVSLTTTIATTFTAEQTQKNESLFARCRKGIHGLVSIFFILMLFVFYRNPNGNMIDLLFQLASYTYGPLLGLFTLSMFTKININDRYAPLICLASPLICWGIQLLTGFALGYELLLLNGFITFVGLLFIKKS